VRSDKCRASGILLLPTAELGCDARHGKAHEKRRCLQGKRGEGSGRWAIPWCRPSHDGHLVVVVHLATRHDFIRLWSRFWLFLTGGVISEPPLRALALPGHAQRIPLATDVHICNVHIAHVVFQHAGQKQYRLLVVSSCILERDLRGQQAARRAVGLSFGSARVSQAFKPTASPLWKETTRGAAPHERFCVQSGVGWWW